MRTVAHISDLHFGRTDAAVLRGLKTAISAAKPDVVVVSGDLTQRARHHEFAAARAFLEELPKPQIVVPGNHDVPLHNVLARWLTPFKNYRRYIGDELQPFYEDEEIAVVGINTARSFTFKGGRINRAQVARACTRFAAGSSGVRIAVTHHPFVLPENSTHRTVVGRAQMAMAAFGGCDVDIVLSGHLHVTQAVTSEAVYGGSRRALLIQAGTGSSSRTREEANSFNLLRIEADRVAVAQHTWANGRFSAVMNYRFCRGNRGWLAEPSAAPHKSGTG
ncbi:MAG: metallophosphoesterase [Alphaproteobacteria bacterium]|nr:metallophosphoesterase [Alphaproteobacteria bacterium]